MMIFEVWFQLNSNLTIAERNAVLMQWLKEAIEDHGLQFGGGGPDHEWQGVAESPSGDATESHRFAVQSWLEKNTFVVAYKIGNLIESD
jgi:uncharacterized protein YggL (DUF469 family)